MAGYLRIVRGIPRMSAMPIVSYCQGLTPGALSANTPITLPASQTYTDVELKVELNGQELEPGIDFTYVGSGARTQIQITFALVATDRLLFNIY